jgi:hypothetical protein
VLQAGMIINTMNVKCHCNSYIFVTEEVIKYASGVSLIAVRIYNFPILAYK